MLLQAPARIVGTAWGRDTILLLFTLEFLLLIYVQGLHEIFRQIHAHIYDT